MSWKRKIAERLSRGRSFSRRLPSDFNGVKVVVSPDAALKYLKPGSAAFSRGLLEFAREFVQSGQVVWDIGANVGIFSYAAAFRAGPSGRVLAVEPDRFLVELLDRANRLNTPFDLNVEVLPVAVSSACGFTTFHIAARGRASNWIDAAGGRSTAGGSRVTRVVPTLTLDSLLAQGPPPDVVKIDVEGAETMALEGAARLLSDARPIIYIEVGEAQEGRVRAVLQSADYELLDGDQPIADRRPLKKCATNTLAIPRERIP